MKSFVIFLVFCSFLLLLPSPTLACIGAEAAGMGLAYVSAVDDVTAAYWNPAALVWVEPSIALGIQRDSPEDYIVIKPNDSPIAFAYITNDRGDSFLLCYSQIISDNCAWGVNIGPDTQSDNPYGITFSASYLVKYPHWRIGLLWQNLVDIRPSVTWSTDNLTICAELYNLLSYRDRYEIRIGASLIILPFMSVQAGYRDYTESWGGSSGGVTYRNILSAYDIDYGLTFYMGKLKIAVAYEQTRIEDGYTCQNYVVSGGWAF